MNQATHLKSIAAALCPCKHAEIKTATHQLPIGTRLAISLCVAASSEKKKAQKSLAARQNSTWVPHKEPPRRRYEIQQLRGPHDLGTGFDRRPTNHPSPDPRPSKCAI